MPRLRSAVIGIVALLALSACSGSDDSSGDSTPATSDSTPTTTSTGSQSPSEPTDVTTTASPDETTSATEPGGGATVTGAGYTVAVPEGWQDVIDQARRTNAQADVAIAEPAQAGEFRLNFNVVQPSALPAGVTDQQLATQAAKELRSVTHAKVTPVDGPAFDGAPSVGQVSHATAGGFNVTLVQYLVRHQGRLYPTTLTFETSRENEAQAVMTGIVGSWTWD
jgi:hypothetical protein